MESRHVSGATPFITACSYGQADVVACLCERRADVNAQLSEDGNTGLHEAALYNHCQVIQEVLKHMPDLKKNAQGQTPLHVAKQCKHKKAASLIRTYVNDENQKGFKVLKRKEKNLSKRPNSIKTINDDIDSVYLTEQYKEKKKGHKTKSRPKTD